MSGHSKWAKIKRKKGANDEARGKIFTKLSRNITIAAQQGGGDPDMNFTLRLAIDAAKSENLPGDKIERAIKKGTGELKEGGQIVQILYEGYGPGSVPMLILSQTDNTNRALTEIKTIMNSKGGKLSGEGGVSWQFSEKGIFVLSPQKFKESEKYGKEGEFVDFDPEEIVFDLMEVEGVEDVIWESGDEYIEVNSAREKFSSVHDYIKQQGYKVEQSELGWVPNETTQLSPEDEDKLEQLVEALDESDEVANVWHNSK